MGHKETAEAGKELMRLPEKLMVKLGKQDTDNMVLSKSKEVRADNVIGHRKKLESLTLKQCRLVSI